MFALASVLVLLAQSPQKPPPRTVKVQVLVGTQPAPPQTEVRLLNPSPLCGTAQFAGAPMKHPDAAGWVTFDGVEQGASISAGHRSLGTEGLSADGDGPFVIRFVAGLPLRGKVVDGQGRPAPRTRVAIISADGEHQLRLQATDETGSFFFSNTTSGRWAVLADSFDSMWSPGVEVEAGAENVVVALPSLASMSGRVVDTGGRAVAEPVLEVRTVGAPWRRPEDLSPPKTQAEYQARLAAWVDPPSWAGWFSGDAQGTFDVSLKTARAVEVRPSSSRLCSRGTWTRVTPGKALELRLPAPATLKLKTPSEKVSVELRAPESLSRADCELNELELTPVDGALSFDAPVAVTELILRTPGHQPVTRRLALAPGKELNLGAITFPLAARLVGKVVDANGRPAAFAPVYLGGEYLLNAQEDGSFVADWVKPGKTQVASLEDNELVAKQRVTLTAGAETPVVITLPASSR